MSHLGGVEDNKVGQDSLDAKTVLILFVGVFIVVTYLISLLLIVIRRAKKLIDLHNRRYYIIIVFYIASKLIICAVLVIQMIVGIANSWENLSSDAIQLLIKTGLVLADFSIIELFLISLEHYFKLCLSTLKDRLSQKLSKGITLALRSFQVLVSLIIIIPLVILDVTDLAYNVLNGIGLGLNLLVMLCFLGTFFYFNFKMTGILVEERLNEVIKRVYKVQLIILSSRIVMIVFQLMVALYVNNSFRDTIEELSETVAYEVVLALVFIGSIVFQLFTEGIPVMYSLRSNVLQSMNFKPNPFEFKQNLQQSLMEKNNEAKEQEVHEMRLKHFKRLEDLASDREESIWVLKKGYLQSKEYIIRISKHEISSYISQDISNQIDLWCQLNISPLSKISYFYEGQIIHIVQKYYSISLDQKVDMCSEESQLIGLVIKIGEAILQLHQNDIIHGCLTPSHIYFDKQKVILNSCGLHSMRKYLSLITGYTNKTMYTAIEHLRDRNNIVLKPKTPADVYSFGVILYEIITKNRQYRQLELRQVVAKFAQENFRPKLPQQIRPEIKTLIRRCWHENPERRPELEEVIDQLRRFS